MMWWRWMIWSRFGMDGWFTMWSWTVIRDFSYIPSVMIGRVFDVLYSTIRKQDMVGSMNNISI